MVQGFPEEGFVGEAEDEKIARRRALPEHVGDGFEVGVRHVERVVGFRGIVEERVDHCGW